MRFLVEVVEVVSGWVGGREGRREGRKGIETAKVNTLIR